MFGRGPLLGEKINCYIKVCKKVPINKCAKCHKNLCEEQLEILYKNI